MLYFITFIDKCSNSFITKWVLKWVPKIEQLIEHSRAMDARLDSMADENTLQCYCLLAALRGLEEQGCDGPVKDGINRLEKYLNKKAHGVA